MFEKAEDEYNDLMSKKNIIEVGIISVTILFCCFLFYLSCVVAE